MRDRGKIGFHNLRRNDGVIMFVVISVMTIMIVVSLAFWVAVSSELTDIKEDFSVEQTYQAAVSVNEWVYDYISTYANTVTTLREVETECPLVFEMLEGMNSIGDTLSTGAISGMEDYGDCSIDIILKNVTETPSIKTLSFDIVSMVENGANAERFTRSCVLEVVKTRTAQYSESEEFFEFSLSTVGGEDNLVSALEGYAVNEPIYLGNDDITWKDGMISSGLNVYGSFRTTGGFYFNNDPTNPIEVNIGKNLTHTNSGPIMACGGKIRIGGYFKTNKPISGITTFYILGEERTDGSYSFYKNNDGYTGEQVFYVNGDVYLNRSTGNCVFFINGNLTIDVDDWSSFGTFYVAGNVNNRNHMTGGEVYYTGTYSGLTGSWNVGGTNRDYTYFFEQVASFPWGGDKAWPESDTDINVALFPGRDYESMQNARFNLRLATADLEVDDESHVVFDENGDPIVVGPKTVPGWDVRERLLELSDGGDMEASENLYLVENNRIEIGTNEPEIIITKSGFIDTTAAGTATKTILIDTMAEAIDPHDPSTHKDIYIKLGANAGAERFKWKSDDWSSNLNIVVRGAGEVVFFLDNGISYQPDKLIFIGHEGWLKFFGLENNIDVSSWFNTNKDEVKARLNDVVHGKEICERSNCLYCSALEGGATSTPGKFVLRQDEEVDLIAQFSTGAEPVYLHNNIFFVDNNQPTNSSFYGTKAIMFGYVFAPYSNTTLPNQGPWSLAAGAFIIGGINCSGNAQYDFYTKHIMPAEYYPFSRSIMNELVGSTPEGQPPIVDYTEEYSTASVDTAGYR